MPGISQFTSARSIYGTLFLRSKGIHNGYVEASKQINNPSPRSFLYLVISAIATLVRDIESGRSHTTCDQALYAQRMLHLVVSEHSLLGIQCLLLFGTYQLLCFRPIQAYEYVIAAAYKVHNIRRRDHAREIVDSEAFKRAFYAIYILERELLVQLNLAGSGLRDLEEHVVLPSGTFEDTQEDSEMFAYFLAEIALQKIMDGSDRNFLTIPSPYDERIHYPAAVVGELDYQVTEWRRHLPTILQFPDMGFCSSDLSLYLKLQYHAHACGIFWFALYNSFASNDLSAELKTAGRKCLLSYCAFTDTASDFFSRPVMLPHLVMTLTSIFTISLSMLIVREAEIAVEEQILEPSVKTAIRVLRRHGTLYPACCDWADVLEGRLGDNGRTTED